MKVALVCIAKDEDNYIEEWITYNLSIGFDKIFVYENDWRLNKEYENVIKIPFDGICRQIEAYNTFITNYNNEYDWVAFFDVDEFLVLKKHNNIKEFISDYKNYNAIGINWVHFGNNNIEKVEDYSVINRFTKREIGVNSFVKSIIKLDKIIFLDNTHAPHQIGIVDTNYNIFKDILNCNGDDNIAQINHYFCKTKTEFIETKIKRGRADHRTCARSLYDYDKYNLNQIEDLFLKKMGLK